MGDVFPERIYLMHEDDCLEMAGEGQCWCQDRITRRDVEYVRKDVVDRLQAALRSARKSAREENQVTMIEFARWCGIMPTQLSEWTATQPAAKPEYIN